MMVKSSCWDMDSLAASSKEIDDCILSRLAMGINFLVVSVSEDCVAVCYLRNFVDSYTRL